MGQDPVELRVSRKVGYAAVKPTAPAYSGSKHERACNDPGPGPGSQQLNARALDMSNRRSGPLEGEFSGLRKLKQLQALNVSGTRIPPTVELGAVLPDQLSVLHVTGCGLEALPTGLSRLKALKHLFAGANKIKDLAPALSLPSLEVLGLSYNPVATLPSPSAMQQGARLLSLDISHCDLTDLTGALESLAALPTLQILNLAGNPICLLPSFSQQARGTTWSKTLAYLDGKRTDVGGNSRPTTARASPPAQLPGNVALPDILPPIQLGGSEPQHLRVMLGPLEVLEDPFAPQGQAAAPPADPAAAAPLSTPPTQSAPTTPPPPAASPPPPTGAAELPAPLGPPQPCYYHYELEGFDGRSLLLEDTRPLWGWTHSQICEALLAQQAAAAAAAAAAPEAAAESGAPGSEGEQAPDSIAALPDGEPPGASPDPAAPAPQADGEGAAGTQTITLVPPSRPDAAGVAQRFCGLLQGAATLYGSVPLKVEPQQAAAAAAAAPAPTPPKGGKGKDDKQKPAANAAAGKAGSKPSTPLGGQDNAPRALQRGSLAVSIPLPANVPARDWLQQGLRLRLYRTRLTAVPKPAPVPSPDAPAATPPPEAPPAKGGKGAAAKGKAAEEKAPPPPVTDLFDIVPETLLVAEGVMSAAAALLVGGSQSAAMLVQLHAVAKLWDDKGFRMPLKDDRNKHETVARVPCSVLLTPSQPASDSCEA